MAAGKGSIMSKFRSSRHHREILLADWRDAEELAAWYLRESLGMSGARITGSGNDGGIDVVADGAIAQVKHVNAPVGAPVVQAALGAGHGSGAVLFFALSGYTRQAEVFAAKSDVCLFQYDIYGEVRAKNESARKLVANGKKPATTSIQDVRMNELRAKAAPALRTLEDARSKTADLSQRLEGVTGLESDNETLAFILAEYAAFFAEPGGYGALGSYDDAHRVLEAARTDALYQVHLGENVRYSKEAVETGFGDLVKLHAELEDLDRLRGMTAPQWVLQLFDWQFRRDRIKYLTRHAHYRPHEDEPPQEAFELQAIMNMKHAGGKFNKLNNPMASRWLKKRFLTSRDDIAACFAAAHKDPINFGADYCLGLFESFMKMNFDVDEGELIAWAYPLGWSRDEMRRLDSLLVS